MVPCPEGPVVVAGLALAWGHLPTDFAWKDKWMRASQVPRGAQSRPRAGQAHAGLTVAAGAVSSSLSDASLLEEISMGRWAPWATAGDEEQAEVAVISFQGDGVLTCRAAALVDVGVTGAGVPFSGEVLG